MSIRFALERRDFAFEQSRSEKAWTATTTLTQGEFGLNVSEVTVSRYIPRRPAEPDQVKRWVACLRNHKDDIAAMDLFTVPIASLDLISMTVACHTRSRFFLSNDR